MSYGFRDIVAERFDAGVRLGKTMDKDMIAVPIGPPLRMAVVAPPCYFESHPKPTKPQDLTAHRCIKQRMPTSGGLYVWDFARRGKHVNVRVDGPLIFNTAPPQVDAGARRARHHPAAEDELGTHLADGSLVRVLEDWCSPFAGHHLYYPSRRQPSLVFRLVL